MTDFIAKAPAMNAACLRYMNRFGLADCHETRAELSDVLDIPLHVVETFSRYGRLIPGLTA